MTCILNYSSDILTIARLLNILYVKNKIMEHIVLRRRFQRRRQRMRILRLQLRLSSDPFNSTTEAEFIKLFRLSKCICWEFINRITPFMENRGTYHSLPKNLRILTALRFLATGSYQRPVGQDFLLAMSQTSVSRYVEEVCGVINSTIAHDVIKFPISEEERNNIKQKFFQKFGIPGVIGLIDGTHIYIKRPAIEIEQVYYAVRKSAHTKNVLLIFDFDLKIITVNAKYGGSAHDSYVWNNSIVKMKFLREYSSGTRGYWLLGDSGYGLQPFLMTPIANPSNHMEEIYNSAHKKARSGVERGIGVLKSRFRCICRQRILMYSPEKAGSIINACAALHNIMIMRGYPLPSEEEIEEYTDLPENATEDGNGISTDSAQLLHEGRRVRNDIINNFFHLS